MDIAAVAKSYARWAPVYDRTFGAVSGVGRKRAVGVLTGLGGRVLEVGVGTGLSLPHYGPGVLVTGIDASAPMLEKARAAARGLAHVQALHLMDAREMDFPDASFDSVTAMHILSVVPEPARVMAQMIRVLRPGGTLLIVNHFARGADRSALSWLERRAAPFADTLGWHSDFARADLGPLGGLTLIGEQRLPPVGMMTMLRFRKA